MNDRAGDNPQAHSRQDRRGGHDRRSGGARPTDQRPADYWPGPAARGALGSPVTLRVLLLTCAAIIVFYYKLGPVVLTLTDSHGVHLGDALAALPALAAVLPHRRLKLDRRLGVVDPITPNPMRRASDRDES